MLRAAVDGHRVHHRIAGVKHGQQGGHNRGHAGVERECSRSAGFERHDLVFQNLRIGMVKTRIDQVDLFIRFALDPAGHEIEGAFRSLRTGEHIGGTAKHRGARGPHGKPRIEASGQDFGRRTEHGTMLVAVIHDHSHFECSRVRTPVKGPARPLKGRPRKAEVFSR